MFKGFRDFIMRGNVIDLAVAVVIGAAFNTVIDKMVDAVINPIVGMFFNAESLDNALKFALPGGGELALGTVVGALLNFLIVAFVVYFAFVMPMNKFHKKADEEEGTPAPPSEQELLQEIRDLLKENSRKP